MYGIIRLDRSDILKRKTVRNVTVVGGARGANHRPRSDVMICDCDLSGYLAGEKNEWHGGPDQHTWISAGSGGWCKKSMHAMNYGKQRRWCSFLLGRPPPVHVYAYYSWLHRHLARRIGVFNPSIIFRSRCDWWQGWRLGLREGSANQTRSCTASGGTTTTKLGLSWRLRGNDGYRVSYRGWAEGSKRYEHSSIGGEVG